MDEFRYEHVLNIDLCLPQEQRKLIVNEMIQFEKKIWGIVGKQPKSGLSNLYTKKQK